MGRGRATPLWACLRVQKDGCAQRTGAHARPKPTSLLIVCFYVTLVISGIKQFFYAFLSKKKIRSKKDLDSAKVSF